jgi:hypothetical protein
MPAGAMQPRPNRIPALYLPLFFIIVFTSFALLTRVRSNPRMEWSFLSAAAVLACLYIVLRIRVARSGRTLSYKFVAQKAHYVQMVMQGLIYVYWGMYWKDVFPFVPMIAAQLLFVYTLDMLITWNRKDDWVMGFGPMPIVLSTNLFIWFKDDWFIYQFALISSGVLGKQFLRWRRDGRLVHIFNPSAFSAFVVSVCLLATHTSNLTWGEDVATTVSRPPYIYLEIFLLGLVVQALFSVTLVTLTAGATLLLLNLGYTHVTGVYHYIDSSIPVAVFIGMHLLITDPATSPRRSVGKIIFGVLYGASIFGLYSVLRWYGQPTFYDKLLTVPLLNLMVPALDRFSNKLATTRWTGRFRVLRSEWALNPARYNYAHMALWIVIFSGMLGSGFLAKGKDHPGGSMAFWQQACQDGRWNACKTWVHTLTVTCEYNYAQSCEAAGEVQQQGALVPRDAAAASVAYGRACMLGVGDGCNNLRTLGRRGGVAALRQACDSRVEGGPESCYTLGMMYSSGGMGVEQDPSRAFEMFDKACDNDYARGCGRMAQSYLSGQGVAADPVKAIAAFDRACRKRDASSCANAGDLYRNGAGGRQDEALAMARFQQACDLGLTAACENAQASATTSP